MGKHNKKSKLWLLVVIAITIAVSIASYAYLSDYYHADTVEISNFSYSDTISKAKMDEGIIAYIPENIVAGFIFYPGGKVEYTSYEPLMLACAEKGILCVLIEMPFNLAVFDVNAADGIIEKFPEVENWYIGGHSLGGSMAASYIAEHPSDFEGLVLLASYSTANLSNSDLQVVSIYGSEDNVLNSVNYQKYKSNLPNNFSEYIIEGGCHAYFGMYGMQKGDGTPTIENTTQIEMTAEKIGCEILEEITN